MTVTSCFQALINDGFSGSQLLLQLHDTLINSPDLSDNQKAVVFEKMGVSRFRFRMGVRRLRCRFRFKMGVRRFRFRMGVRRFKWEYVGLDLKWE